MLTKIIPEISQSQFFENAHTSLQKKCAPGRLRDQNINSCCIENRREGNDQEPIQLSNTSHQRHQRERNTNMK